MRPYGLWVEIDMHECDVTPAGSQRHMTVVCALTVSGGRWFAYSYFFFLLAPYWQPWLKSSGY